MFGGHCGRTGMPATMQLLNLPAAASSGFTADLLMSLRQAQPSPRASLHQYASVSEHWRLHCQLCSDLYGSTRVLKYYIAGKWCKRTLRDPEGLGEGKESLVGARILEKSTRLHCTQFGSSSQILRAWPLVSGAIMLVLPNCINLGNSLEWSGGAFIPSTSCSLESVYIYSLRGLFPAALSE